MKKIEGEVEKKTYINPVPKAWNVNSDRFESLYIKSAKSDSEKNLSSALIGVSSAKSEGFGFKKKTALKKSGDKMFELENINFKRDVIPPYIAFPALMKLTVFDNGDKKVCSEKFKFEVVK
ncbi:MAG: hypothetical protein WD025_00350 [Bacteriovoracaceae bacterium]